MHFVGVNCKIRHNPIVASIGGVLSKSSMGKVSWTHFGSLQKQVAEQQSRASLVSLVNVSLQLLVLQEVQRSLVPLSIARGRLMEFIETPPARADSNKDRNLADLKQGSDTRTASSMLHVRTKVVG